MQKVLKREYTNNHPLFPTFPLYSSNILRAPPHIAISTQQSAANRSRRPPLPFLALLASRSPAARARRAPSPRQQRAACRLSRSWQLGCHAPPPRPLPSSPPPRPRPPFLAAPPPFPPKTAPPLPHNATSTCQSPTQSAVFSKKSPKNLAPFENPPYLCTRNSEITRFAASMNRGVAQLVSVRVWGACGRWFESSHPDFNKELQALAWSFSVYISYESRGQQSGPTQS